MQSYKRSEYTHDEQLAIVDYIIKNKCYTGLRGNLIWQEMERQKIINRSWQSVKEHFKKKIINILHIFRIPNEDKRLIKEGWESTRVVTNGPNFKNIKRSRLRLCNEIDDKKSEQNDSNYGISDDSSSSLEMKPSKGKTFKKKKPIVKNQPRSPSKFNLFSDEELDTTKNSSQSSDLLKESTNKSRTPTIINNLEEINLPSTSNLKTSNKKIAVEINQQNSSDSDDKTSGSLSNSSDNTTIYNQENIEFSLEEDVSLLNFMRLDKTYLKRRHDIKVYQYYHEIYPDSKKPEVLQRRFLNYIFPNIYKYNQLTHEEMCLVYTDSGVEIPDILKDNALNNSIKSINNKSKNKNVRTGVCEHLINKFDLNCMYSQMVLNNEPHIFVNNTNNENISDIISKKFNIQPNNIHYTNFDTFSALEQVNEFRTTINQNFGDIISRAIKNKSENINVNEIISNLETCIQSFSNEVNTNAECLTTECETALEELVCTQDFIPNEKSTPENIKNSPNIINSQSKDITVHNYNKEFSENLSNSENQIILNEKNSENEINSQYLESIPSEENIMINVVRQIVQNTSINSSSEEIFYTADCFSQ